MASRSGLLQRTIAALHPNKIMGPDGIIRKRADERALNQLALGCFSTPAGRAYLDYLRSITVNNVTGPATSADELRHLEGQRFLVALSESRIELGKRNEPKDEPEPEENQ